MAAATATGVVVGSAVAAASAPPVAVGTVVTVLPGDCTATIVGGVSFQQCGSTWFKPQYDGTAISYIVVTPPR